jgi:hypothetical protein
MSIDNQQDAPAQPPGADQAVPAGVTVAHIDDLPDGPVVVDNLPVIGDEPATETQVEPAKAAPAVKSEEAAVAKTNAIQDFPLNMVDQALDTERLILPSALDAETGAAMMKAPNVKLAGTEADRAWANTVSEGLSYNTMREGYVPTLAEEGSEFRQNNLHNGQNLNGAVPRFRQSENQTLSGEKALIQLVGHLGLGTVFQVPLWHSGIWLTFKPPTDAEIVELNRRIMMDKINFGRSSYGMALSNTTSYTVDRLVSFALDHVYDMTTKAEDINMGNLRDHIAAQDLHSLLWGFICTMYPRGFRYDRACVTDPEKCKHVVHETLNVHKLQWTNMKVLSDWQKVHMSGRQAKMKSLADVQRYRQELSRQQDLRVTVNEGKQNEFSFTLRTPSLTEYINAGHEWISSIVENVDASIALDARQEERDHNITLQGQATAMRQYSHWVASIEYMSNRVEDRETINEILAVVTADPAISSEFTRSVVDYINKSTMSVIGIPTYNCPKCHAPQKGEDNLPAHTNVIPLDVLQVFFGLITQRLEKIAAR